MIYQSNLLNIWMFLISVIIYKNNEYYINKQYNGKATTMLNYLGWESLNYDKTKQNESEER